MSNNQLLASDSFASGSLAAGWAAFPTLLKCQVIAGTPNLVEANAINTAAGQYWTGAITGGGSWPSDQISEATIQTIGLSDANVLQLGVRVGSGYTGYLANIEVTSGGASKLLQVYRTDSSVSFTQLGSNVTGLTLTTGDVWALQAAGACISVYQNGKRIFYFYDATYTSGSPSFTLTAVSNITHLQIASWRGYSAVQQDGIWQKQGIVIPANATDLTPDGTLVFGAFQISKIYKVAGKYTCLFASGVGTTGAGGNGNIYFASSPDGKAPWTRSVAPVIANYTNPSLWFDGITYHCYCQSVAAISGNIAHFTSPDMTSTSTWTSISTNVLAPASGQWDDTIFLLAPMAKIGSTIYANYTGNHNSSQYKVGLATSTDGGDSWAKDAGNPVLTAANGGCIVGSQAVTETPIGDYYYAWFYGNQPGQGSTNPFQDPFDAVRYKTTDFKTDWALDAHSQHHTEQFEALNTNTGGVAPCAIIDIGGKAYMYSLSCPNDAVGPQIYQTSLAIAPAPIASIITAQENALKQTAADAFTSGAGDLSANWAVITGIAKLKIVAGPYVEPTALSTVCAQYYVGSFSADQYSAVKIQTLSGTKGQDYIFPIVRAQASGANWYQANLAGPTGTKDTTQFAIFKTVAGSSAALTPISVGVTPQVGDVFTLVATGTDPVVLTLFQNDFVILQGVDLANTFTSGNPGMYQYDSTNLAHSQIASWSGGNANVIPTYPPLPVSGNTSHQQLRIHRN